VRRPGPRLFCIPAARAPIVAVLRRGPSAWSHVGRWNLERGTYDAGAWIRANLYPQRCDLSPDGRWLCYFTLKQSATWKAGPTYVAISRSPWLTALAAWRTCGTWTRGFHFVERKRVWEIGEPAVGDVGPCRRKFGLAGTRPATFAVERRRGWSETEDSPARDPGDVWDERRAEQIKMEKPRPKSGGRTRLVVQGWFAAFRASVPATRKDVRYEVIEEGLVHHLSGVQWADWHADGRLLVATMDGRLQVRDGPADDATVSFELDLSGARPRPSPPPPEARRW